MSKLTGALLIAVLAGIPAVAMANGATSEPVGAGPAATPSAEASPAATPSPPASTSTTTTGVTYSTNQLIPLTVAEAWELSGRNEANFARMIQQMSELSARNRGINLPDSREAGMEIGQMIRNKSQADPNQLLYSVVDSSLVEYKAKHAAEAVGAGPAAVTYSANQLMPLTVAQAWRLSGGDYGNASRMIKTLVEVSAERRGIDLPDTKEAGTEIGQLVRQKAEADQNQLLYVVVDSSLREYAAKHAIPAQP